MPFEDWIIERCKRLYLKYDKHRLPRKLNAFRRYMRTQEMKINIHF